MKLQFLFCSALLFSVVSCSCLVEAGHSMTWQKTDEVSNVNSSTVLAAFDAEANGDFERRNQLLKSAIECVGEENNIPDAAKQIATAARWHSGQINLDQKEWLSIQDCIAKAQSSDRLKDYHQARSGMQENVDDHLTVARWCVDKQLFVQARAHLERVIDIDPDHRPARNVLGYTRVGNDWISSWELDNVARETEVKQASIYKYGKTVSKLVDRMNSRRAKNRDRAIAELMKLKEADAVGAVEAALASDAIAPSKVALDWLDQIDTVESSKSLARYSLIHPNEQVRQYATSKLITRPKYDFVPELLNLLSSSITMQIVPQFDNQGLLAGYQHAFAREDFDGKEFMTLDRGFLRQSPVGVPQNGSNGPQTLTWQNMLRQQLERRNDQVVRDQAELEIQERTETMERQNRLISERNSRIGSVISQVSGRPFTVEPKAMWDWWDNYNETEYQDYKPERYQSETFNTSLPPTVVAIPTGGTARVGECFVAGTPVMTCLGIRKIEDIETGDLVLSRNVMSGELGWQPVLRPTTRPASPTVNLTIKGESNEAFRCSTGHLFWVSGSGWKKASELKPGDVLHGAARPSTVLSVKAADPVETHNLEVADNANYFVGEHMIMTHDVTPRRTNRQTVPGQQILERVK